jgi:hypothetical protein
VQRTCTKVYSLWGLPKKTLRTLAEVTRCSGFFSALKVE